MQENDAVIVYNRCLQESKKEREERFKMVGEMLKRFIKGLPQVEPTIIGVLPKRMRLSNALVCAVSDGNARRVCRLLARGADPNTYSQFDDTVTTIAVMCKYYDVLGHLIAAGADVSAASRFTKITPLMWASLLGDEKSARMLVEKGADPNAVNFSDCTALMLAVAGGHYEVVKILVAAGANINYVNYMGKSALDISIEKQYDEIIKFLLFHM